MMLGINDFILERVLEESVRAYAPLAKATGAELLVVPSPHLPLVCSGEASLVRRLLTAMLSRVVFFRDGEVRMDVFVNDGGPLVTRDAAQYAHLRIVVASIPSVRWEHAPRSMRWDQKSLGGFYDEFGASLENCSELARMLGGDVHVSDSPDRGLSITANIILGVIATEPQQYVLPVALESGRKALIIDDHSASRIVLTDLLDRLGLEALSVSSIQASVDLVQRELDRIGVVLVDGKLVSGEVRQDILSAGVALAPDVPVVVMDYVDTSQSNILQGSRCDTQVRLCKPVTPSALCNALESAFMSYATDRVAASDVPSADMPSFPGLRALVVDDNEFNLEVFESILAMAGIEVATAASGPEALSILERGPAFDVVLMDMQMPDMDGCETTRRIRANPTLKDIPILALTANTIPGAREQCLASGMNDFLTKPVDTPAMFRALARWIGV